MTISRAPGARCTQRRSPPPSHPSHLPWRQSELLSVGSQPLNIWSYRICFVKLKLLLLAIEEKTGEGEEGKESKIWINPRDFKIAPNTVGFFIAQSAEEVKRFAYKASLTLGWHSVFCSEPGFTASPAMRKSGMKTSSENANADWVSWEYMLSFYLI